MRASAIIDPPLFFQNPAPTPCVKTCEPGDGKLEEANDVKRTIFLTAGLAALATVPALRLLAQPASTPWVHIRVEEPRKPSKVSVNLPLTVVQAALKSAPDTVGSHGRIHLGRHQDMSVADFRRLWTELKAAGDSDLVSVEEEKEWVRVARRGDVVEVRVEKPKGTQAVHVQVPVSLVDALFSGEGDELNLEAAISELQKRRGDIVQVNDENGSVRIWIDEGN
jgi:hypothetical protein